MPDNVSATTVQSSFEKKVHRLRAMVRKASSAQRKYGTREFSLGTVDAIYEAAYLNLYSSFESFVEDLFYSVLLGESGIPHASPIVQFRNRAEAFEVLRGGREFVTWLPWDNNVRNLASTTLLNAEPFSRIDHHKSELSELDRIRIIRNSIAHDSGASKYKAKKWTNLPSPRRRHAAGYLQTVSSGKTNFELDVDFLVNLSGVLIEPDRLKAKARLAQLDAFRPGQQPGPGKFKCLECGVETKVGSFDTKLKVCPTRRRHNKKSYWELLL